MTTVYYMQKKYQVPDGLTIHKAMEAVGIKLLFGCGCRGGFCGACGTLYRTEGDPKLKVGLACQTVVEENMYFAMLPYFPAERVGYSARDIDPKKISEIILSLYPTTARCIQCNSCTKICPQNNKVMNYVASAIKGDIESLAKESFNCLMCALCASRCPGEVNQFNVGLLGRRLYSLYYQKDAEHLKKCVEEINSGMYDIDFEDIMTKSKDELKKLYEQNEIEK